MIADTFVPLRRRSGICAADFMHDRAGRTLVIWGAGMLGRCLMQQLSTYAVPRSSLVFADSNPALICATVDGHPVIGIDDAISRASSGMAFVLVALAGHTHTAMRQLTDAGLKAGTDYESYLKLSRPEAVIQVSGRGHACDIQMSLEHYCAILSKLKADLPDLFHIDLAGWGDPLNHPAIADMIAATRPVVPCTLTTRLDADIAVIERALRAEPTQFVISVDDDQGEAFFNRLRRVTELKDEIADRVELRVKYTRYRDNGAGFATMHTRCAEFGLKLVEAIGYIDPYDTVLTLCESGDLESVHATRLAWPLREALKLACADRAQHCLCQRIFPVINPDGSTAICHLYAQPRLNDDYLLVGFDALLDQRLDATHCRACQQHALHRLDIDVLQTRHAINLTSYPEYTHA